MKMSPLLCKISDLFSSRAELDALRRAHSEVLTQVSSVGEIKPIDWAYYAKAVQVSFRISHDVMVTAIY